MLSAEYAVYESSHGRVFLSWCPGLAGRVDGVWGPSLAGRPSVVRGGHTVRRASVGERRAARMDGVEAGDGADGQGGADAAVEGQGGDLDRPVLGRRRRWRWRPRR